VSIDEVYADFVAVGDLFVEVAIVLCRIVFEVIGGFIVLVGFVLFKSVVKLVSEVVKFDGFFVVELFEVWVFLDFLLVIVFGGVGLVMVVCLSSYGICIVVDFVVMDDDDVVCLFGLVYGYGLFVFVCGEDDCFVELYCEVKLVLVEEMFEFDLCDFVRMVIEVDLLAVKVVGCLRKEGFVGCIVMLKVCFVDFIGCIWLYMYL